MKCFPQIKNNFKNQNPARGRKRIKSMRFCAIAVSFKNQNPARGRKQERADKAVNALTFFLRTRTPQGDGNWMM